MFYNFHCRDAIGREGARGSSCTAQFPMCSMLIQTGQGLSALTPFHSPVSHFHGAPDTMTFPGSQHMLCNHKLPRCHETLTDQTLLSLNIQTNPTLVTTSILEKDHPESSNCRTCFLLEVIHTLMGVCTF